MEPHKFQTNIWIYLYEGIKFQEKEFVGVDNTSEEPVFIEEGYYYCGKKFRLSNLTDLTKEWKGGASFEKIDFDSSLLKDKEYLGQKFTELNKKELAKAKKYLKYWEEKQINLQVPVPVPLIYRIMEYYSTVIFYFNEWFSRIGKSNIIEVTKSQHKKDYTKEVKLFIKILIKNILKGLDPNETKLRDLVKDSQTSKDSISFSTWSRRLNDKNFLSAVLFAVNDQRKLANDKGKLKTIDHYDQIIEFVSIRLSKVRKKQKKDVWDKNKIDRRIDVSEIEDKSQGPEDYEDLNYKEFSSSFIIPSNKLILN